MQTKLELFAATVRAFLRSERGNIAIMFGIALIPLMIGAGAGLDFARAMMVRQQMAEALDAAALAIGSTPGLNSAGAQALAQKYFDINYTVDKTLYGTATVNPPVYDAKGSVSLSATNSMPTVLMKLAGINAVPISATSMVVWGQTKLWVSLVLDNSGSM
ncbi:MAG: TadE/TadG family type IV pilus assembly protein, partial [Rhizomicrobium sp.]